ncbi:putative 28S rRNA (cytosine-C(5))-methyltransferase [Aspergillus nanangensis]|uniref:28S rRNA (Cytosine-C(5))-methyltransferase n=1 Tax=Aspergillus nanangensis TaxID=2582783 RepID=A0AAD4GNE5_ASPNN|nr:putative 28S rRNA (cytosine-C(5))-methyltransferase [Aspergillus nanangensis]
MSLYYDAEGVLTAPASTGGSFKSRIYNSRSLRASPAQIYALVIEASKWDLVLKEVIDNAGILKLEPKLTPLLSLLLVHDHLIAKKGIAAPTNHPLRQAIERHKTRLRAEFVKARVRRGCATVPELKDAIRREKGGADETPAAVYPRWVRVNNVRSSLEAQLESTFRDYRRVESIPELGESRSAGDKKIMRMDPHIPDLVAFPPGVEMNSTPAYVSGEIILQDKASCFPAYLLLGDRGDMWSNSGDLIDGCAAPGNKTTHLGSILCKSGGSKKKTAGRRIFSLDASQARAKTLQKMVATAGANSVVTVLPGQDFLALDPADERFENVSGLLLDPSCSGSGIIGREDVPTLVLPGDEKQAAKSAKSRGKKRKLRHDEGGDEVAASAAAAQGGVASASATDENELASSHLDPERLTKLSNLQTRIVEHALSFPAATRITYSTCSIHLVENESVVARVLSSEVAKRRGWRVMRRNEQPEGLRKWEHRGVRTDATGPVVTVDLTDEDLEGCLRCWPGDEEGTGGFFVAGFVRDESLAEEHSSGASQGSDDEEWGGFSD